MVPEVELMDRPLGSPVADHVKLWSRWVSVAVLGRAVMALPDGLAWLPGLATDTEPVTVQVKLAEPMAPEPLVAVSFAWLPGLATDTEPVTVQVKLAEPMAPEPLVAVRVTV